MVKVWNATSEAGFTLVEMLTVLLVMAMAGATAFQFYPTAPQPTVNRETKRVLAFVKSASSRARETNRVVSVLINLPMNQFSLGSSDADRIELPPGFEISVRSGRELTISKSQTQIRFFPQGGSTGGEIGILRKGDHEGLIKINWLTGSARILEQSNDANAE